jgi:hypothetical protein
MNNRYLKQWQITESLLNKASLQISSTEFSLEFREFISHNELGLAFETLVEAGLQAQVDHHYWWNLKKAAEVMELQQHLNFLRRKIRETKN